MGVTATERRESGSSWQLRFRSNESVDEAVKRIITALTDEMVSLLDEPTTLGIDKTVHEVRRGGKQARSLLRLVRPAIGGGFKEIDRRFRDAGRLLAGARDARIVVDTLDGIAAREHGAADIRSSLQEEAARQGLALFEGSDSPAIRASVLLREAKKSVLLLEIPDEAASIADGAARTYRGGLKALGMASSHGSPEAFHTWRKRVKQRRHQIAYMWDCTPPDEDSHAMLYELSDDLGNAHDLVVFAEALNALSIQGAHDATHSLAESAELQRTKLETEALDIGVGLFEPKPKAIRRAIVADWTTWRSHTR